MSIIEIFTDGSCINNGKNFARCAIGIYFPKKEFENVSKEITSTKINKTNQTAELLAILKSLKITKKVDKEIKIKIYTDSLYCINSLTKWYYAWEKNNWLNSNKKQVKNKEIIQKIIKYIKKKNIDFVHVRSHTHKKDYYSINNDIADQLAKKPLL